MNVWNSQRTQTAGFCLHTGTQSWQSPVSSDGRRRWATPCTHPCWTPDSFLEAPRKNCEEKDLKINIHFQSGFRLVLRPTRTPVAGEPVISVGTVFQGGCQATESSRHGIPLVEADTAAEGVASRRTLGTLLSRHLQELPSLAWEGWRIQRDGNKRNTESVISQPSLLSHNIKARRLKGTEDDRSCKL